LFHGSCWLLLARRYDSSILLPGPVRVHGSGLLELDAGFRAPVAVHFHGSGLLELVGDWLHGTRLLELDEWLHGTGLPQLGSGSGLLEPLGTDAVLEPWVMQLHGTSVLPTTGGLMPVR